MAAPPTAELAARPWLPCQVRCVNEDDAKLALPRSCLVCGECGRIDRGERGWTLRSDIDEELVAFCPGCDAREFS